MARNRTSSEDGHYRCYGQVCVLWKNQKCGLNRGIDALETIGKLLIQIDETISIIGKQK